MAAALLFAALAILVGVGSLTQVDQWSVEHLMPGLNAASENPSPLSSAFPIFDPGKASGHVTIAAATYALVWLASAVPSVLLVGAAVAYLWRQARVRLAAGLGAAFAAANVVELIGKVAITRPALVAHTPQGLVHLTPFDSSYPSGHERRAVLLVACLVACAPRLWPLGASWITAVSVLLVAGGWHVPSDVAGGFVLAAVAVLTVRVLISRRGSGDG